MKEIHKLEQLKSFLDIEEKLQNSKSCNPEFLSEIVRSIPKISSPPDKFEAKLNIHKEAYLSSDLENHLLQHKFSIKSNGEEIGSLEIYFKKQNEELDEFETLLLQKIVKSFENLFALDQKTTFEKELSVDDEGFSFDPYSIVQILEKFDPYLLSVLSRKMLNFLLCRGISQAKDIYAQIQKTQFDPAKALIETNKPTRREIQKNTLEFTDEIFQVATAYLTQNEITQLIQKWIYEDKANFLVRLLANQSIPLKEIAEAIRKYYFQTPNLNEYETKFSQSPALQGIRVALARRLLSDQLEYIHIAKNYITIKDFYEILQKTIITTEGLGRLGGKAAGLILSNKILESYSRQVKSLFTSNDKFSIDKIKVPRTWFIPSDSFYDFLYYNNLEDIIEQKYKPLEDIRNEYPNIVQVLKNAQFPPELINGITRALDDLGDRPIVVRSSSLLEDRLGASFPGKYKSIFLANTGTKEERLTAMLEAIAEVYASVFSPDPIGYRIEHGLLDFNEEMGVMIQEVVGKKVGDYFFPAFAGVVFSINEFRWSPRIEREDGLVRLVPGLGTRAVDRISDDYPILVSPGKPNLRLHTTTDDYLRYSPRKIDVINLKTNQFETLDIELLIKQVGNNYPSINEVFSKVFEDSLQHPIGLGIDTTKDELVVTFENLFSKTNFLSVIKEILQHLRKELQVVVDIEFAYDGQDLYILQCRSQSSTDDFTSAVIPRNIPKDDLFFRLTKFVSNGRIPDIEYIVYVDPINYYQLTNPKDFLDVAEAIGKLNEKLPAKKFILIGPGRWGTRDNYRLGVPITYSSINHTAVLMEIAHNIGDYKPDLSFGTHFFQDLVEANIKYFPIYLDDEATFFDELFIQKSRNFLHNLIDGYYHLSNVLKVINVQKETNGKILRVLANGDLNLAVGFFIESQTSPIYYLSSEKEKSELQLEEPWEKRWKFVEKMIDALNLKKYGIKAIYLFGTVYNRTAKESSDIDLLVHYDGNPENLIALKAWFEPWNYLLQEIIFTTTGFRLKKALDVYYITDEECNKQNYYFVEIMNTTKKNSIRLR
ncbi:MAG: PEP/pyruvate-binding domain-containing protein [Candidatus Kapaibacteriales bacterium]